MIEKALRTREEDVRPCHHRRLGAHLAHVLAQDGALLDRAAQLPQSPLQAGGTGQSGWVLHARTRRVLPFG